MEETTATLLGVRCPCTRRQQLMGLDRLCRVDYYFFSIYRCCAARCNVVCFPVGTDDSMLGGGGCWVGTPYLFHASLVFWWLRFLCAAGALGPADQDALQNLGRGLSFHRFI